jgi:acyl carrier protein
MTRAHARELFMEAFAEVKGALPATTEIGETVPLTALDVDSLDLIEMMMVVSDLSHQTVPDAAMHGAEAVGDVISALAALEGTA